MFFPLLLVRIYFGFSSNRVIFCWARLELNIISVLPLLVVSNGLMGTEVAIKYLLIQAWGSRIFLWSAFLRPTFALISRRALTLALGLKLGAAPMHLWFIRVVRSSSWELIFILSTLQKVLPTYFLSIFSTQILGVLVIIRAIIASLGVFNSSTVKAILGYSSVFTVSWVLRAVQAGRLNWAIYLIIYGVRLAVFLYLVSSYRIFRVSQMGRVKISLFSKLSLFITLVAIGGLPPLVSFWAKLLVLSDLLNRGLRNLSLILVIRAVWILAIYVRIGLSILLLETLDKIRFKVENSVSLLIIRLLAAILPIVLTILPVGVKHIKFWFLRV